MPMTKKWQPMQKRCRQMNLLLFMSRCKRPPIAVCTKCINRNDHATDASTMAHTPTFFSFIYFSFIFLFFFGAGHAKRIRQMINQDGADTMPKNYVLRPAIFNCTNCLDAEFPCFQSCWSPNSCYHCTKYGYKCQMASNTFKPYKEKENVWQFYFRNIFYNSLPRSGQGRKPRQAKEAGVNAQTVLASKQGEEMSSLVQIQRLDEKSIARHLFAMMQTRKDEPKWMTGLHHHQGVGPKKHPLSQAASTSGCKRFCP